jgi:hypothetical protein
MTYNSAARGFLHDHESALLELLVTYVTSDEDMVVVYADTALRELTGQAFGHEEDSRYIMDSTAPQQWREYVARRLAEKEM